LFDRVLIEKAEAVAKTKGGLYIPEKAQGKVVTGTVVATGPGGRNEVWIAFSRLSFYVSMS
jgi:chaperonin GroES